MPIPYNILGRQLDRDPIKYLHDGVDITDQAERDGSPGEALTVEFIGRKMVELSKDPVLPGDPRYAAVTEQIKNAMIVRFPTGATPPSGLEDDLWEKLVVELDYDTRLPETDEIDRNRRVLVVPAGETLALRESGLSETGAHFSPPLTYFLDKLMMGKFFYTKMETELAHLVAAKGAESLAEVHDDLLELIQRALGDFITFEDGATAGVDELQKIILNNPKAAFHRAVGIYITNMCD